MENSRRATSVPVPHDSSSGNKRSAKGNRRVPMRTLGLIARALLALASGCSTYGQQSAPLPVDTVLHMKFLGRSLRNFSPDGKWIAYTVRSRSVEKAAIWADVYARTGISSDAMGTDLVAVDAATHETRNISAGEGSNWLPSWSPNGRYLAFLSDRDGSGQAKLWVWDSTNNSTRKVSDVIVRMPGPQQIAWLPQGGAVVVTVLQGDAPSRVSATPVEIDAHLNTIVSQPSTVPQSTVTVYSALSAPGITRSNPFGLAYLKHDLAVVNIASGKVERIVEGQRISTFHVINRAVVFSVPQEFEQSGSQQILYKISIVSLTTKQEHILVSGIRLRSEPSFSVSPDETLLCYRAGGSAEKVMDFYLVSLAGGNPRNLTQFKPSTVSHGGSSAWRNSSKPLWSRDGKFVYYTVEGSLWRTSAGNGDSEKIAASDGHSIRQLAARADDTIWMNEAGDSTIVIMRSNADKDDAFYSIDLKTGALTKLRENGECYTCEMGIDGRLFDVSKDGHSIAFSAENAQRPGDIWAADTSFHSVTRLTKVNPEIEDYRTATARLVDWYSDDGERLQGVLLLPPDFSEGKRYPMIVLVYGGLMLSDWMNRYGGLDRALPYMNTQLLATRGYVVFMPDAPQHIGTPMLDLAKTVLPGISKMVEMGIADPKKVGVLGQSYGGYTTLSLIVQSHRFKAAVELNGPGSLPGLYGEMAKDGSAFGASLDETGQALLGGSPWKYRDRYIENSPTFYLDRVETPLLILHGSEDETIAAFLGDELFVGLRRLNKDVEYAKYWREGHELMSYANQLDAANRIIRWFDSHLK